MEEGTDLGLHRGRICSDPAEVRSSFDARRPFARLGFGLVLRNGSGANRTCAR